MSMARSVPDLLIRKATEADLPELQRVFHAASLSNAGDREALLANPEFLVFAGDGIASGRTRVAEAGKCLIGFASAAATTATDRGEIELEDLFVDPEWRRRGVARALIEDAVRIARQHGGRRITVTGNEHALPFYLSVGFVRVGEAPTQFGPAPRLRRDL